MEVLTTVFENILYAIYTFCSFGKFAAICLGIIGLVFIIGIIIAERITSKQCRFFTRQLPLSLGSILTYGISVGILFIFTKILKVEFVITNILFMAGVINIALILAYFLIVRFVCLPLSILCVLIHRKPKNITKINKKKSVKVNPTIKVENRVSEIAKEFTRTWIQNHLTENGTREEILLGTKTEYINGLSEILKDVCDKPKITAEQIFNDYIK